MDVTFFEHQSYYQESVVQGESLSEQQPLENTQTRADTVPSSTDTGPSPAVIHLEPSPSPTPHPSTQPAPQELRVYTRRDRTGGRIENQTLPAAAQESNPAPNLSETHSGMEPLDTSDCELTPPVVDDSDVPIAIRKGVRSCTQHPISRFVSYEKLSPSYHAFVTAIDSIEVPNSIQEALLHPGWRKAVNEEVAALETNGTWIVSDLPENTRPVGCRWLFTIKCKADGSIDRLKARLVAKGYTQSYGIDYQETFAPVAKLNSIRILLSIAANRDWPLMQLDVKNAFLNGDLKEDVYMDIPPGLEGSFPSGKVCKLQKSLYGLKQSPRAWFARFTNSVIKCGYTQSQADHTMFIKRSEKKIAVLIVYVDDIILTGDHTEELTKLKKFLAHEFEIKDLGDLKFFLGMEVARSKMGIAVTQRKYTLDLLKETGMLGCKPVDTPMDPYKKIGMEKDSLPVDKGRYQRLVGRLIYLSHTRPDISFPVSMVSQFMNYPTEEHMGAVNRILRYLKMTPGKGLLFKKDDSQKVEVFTDADWAGDITDRRSTSGYCSYVCGNLVTWRSKKQSVVSRSSAEAEYRALALGICEGMWIRRFLKELGIMEEISIRMLCDNQAAISIAKNPVHHDRTKHIEIDRNFISEKVDNGTIELVYTPSRDQIADILTKALPKSSFDELNTKLGMYNLYNPT